MIWQRLTAMLDKSSMDRLSDRIYISLDIDVLEPGLMPGTGTPEPGGLTGWNRHTCCAMCRRHTVIAADIVETAPTGSLYPNTRCPFSC